MKLINLITPITDISELQPLLAENDIILLRQDAVYLLLRQDILWPVTQLYALESDLLARQLAAPASVKVISDIEWVALTCEADQVLLW